MVKKVKMREKMLLFSRVLNFKHFKAQEKQMSVVGEVDLRRKVSSWKK